MIEVTLSDVQQLNIELTERTGFQVEIGSELVIAGQYEEYTGPYTVIPSTVTQTLSTADKHVRNNISIREIPYAEVSNAAGGNTVTIG